MRDGRAGPLMIDFGSHDRRDFQTAFVVAQKTDLRAVGAELVLHGHTHLPTLSHIPGPDGKVPVAGISSASQSPGGRMPASAYNLFEISGSKGKWQCGMQHFELTERSASSVERRQISLHGRGAA